MTASPAASNTSAETATPSMSISMTLPVRILVAVVLVAVVLVAVVLVAVVLVAVVRVAVVLVARAVVLMPTYSARNVGAFTKT